MEEKELQEILNKAAKQNGQAISESVKKEVLEATKGLMKTEDFASKLESFGLKDNAIKELTEAVEKHGMELAKMIDGKTESKSLDEIIYEKGDAIKALSEGNAQSFKMRVKANKAVINSGSLTGSTLSYRENSIGQLAAPNTVFEKIFRTVNLSEADLKLSNGVISYMDVASETNNAAETAEHAGQVVGVGNKPESAITWQEYSKPLRVIADTIPVTRNSYRHLGFIASEIDRLLRKNQAQRKDGQIYNGDGAGANLTGIYTYTTAVTLASLPRYLNVVQPNLADLVMDLSVYVSNKPDATGAQNKYAPNILFINPDDALRFLEKGNDGHYLLPPFMQNGKVGRVEIVESPKVVPNTLMVGDASYGTIYQSEDVVIEMGLVNDQFLKNQWTIRAEQELCFLQHNADLGAFVKVTDIGAALTALIRP